MCSVVLLFLFVGFIISAVHASINAAIVAVCVSPFSFDIDLNYYRNYLNIVTNNGAFRE